MINKTKELDEGLSLRGLLIFFLPLALTSILISITHSLFNAGLARLAKPEILISSFAVAKSIMYIFQSPMMMFKQTVTSLISDKESYFKVRKFIAKVFSIGIVLYVVFAFTDLSEWFIMNILGLEGLAVSWTIIILRIFTVFIAGVALREFMQGVAIRFKLNPLITIGTGVRILYVWVFVSFINKLYSINPAVVAGLLLTGAGLLEGFTVFTGVKIFVRNIPERLNILNRGKKNKKEQVLKSRTISSFYVPLLLTVFVKTLGGPLINTGLAQTVEPKIAITVYAVGLGLGGIVTSPILAFHQVSLYYLKENFRENYKVVVRFAVIIGVILTLIIAVLGFTSLGYYILLNWISVSQRIADLAVDIVRWMVVLPALMLTREYLWGYFMSCHKTGYISKGKIFNVVFLALSIFVLIAFRFENPALKGIIAYLAAEISEIVYLLINVKKIVDE